MSLDALRTVLDSASNTLLELGAAQGLVDHVPEGHDDLEAWKGEFVHKVPAGAMSYLVLRWVAINLAPYTLFRCATEDEIGFADGEIQWGFIKNPKGPLYCGVDPASAGSDQWSS